MTDPPKLLDKLAALAELSLAVKNNQQIILAHFNVIDDQLTTIHAKVHAQTLAFKEWKHDHA